MENLLEEGAEGGAVHAPLPTVEEKGFHPPRVPILAKNASCFVIAATVASAGDFGTSHDSATF